jgi:hypothetical protein
MNVLKGRSKMRRLLIQDPAVADLLPLLVENGKILNTNIPMNIMGQLKVPAQKWIEW